MDREGVSPILATVIMVLIVLGMAGGAYTFLSQGQEIVTGETERVELETVNTTCLPGRITWWVNNTGEFPTGSSTADLFVYGEAGLNSSLSTTGISVEGFTRSYGRGKVEVEPAKDMKLGGQYSLQLEVGDARLSTSCSVGADWWDANWEYRRALDLSTSSDVTAEAELDAESLVDNGKLRSDCADIRGVKGREVVPYVVPACDTGGLTGIRMNLSGAEPGRVYVYYGNLQAGSAEASPFRVEDTVVRPELGPEERVNLP